MKWIRRWRKEGYRDLWYLVHGDGASNGLQRDFNLAELLAKSWRNAYEGELRLRKEAEAALTEAGVPIPREVRYNKFLSDRKIRIHDEPSVDKEKP